MRSNDDVMEDQTPETQVNQSISDTVIQTEQQPKQSNFLVILLSILLTLSVLIVGFFAFQTQKLVKELNNLKNNIKPVAEVTPAPTSDPTADWKTYTNTRHGFLLKYSPNWKLENLDDRSEFNANPRLVNGNSVIQIYANMDGLGGIGVDYTGIPIVVSGINLYKYESENTYGKTKQVGITDQLKKSFGVFNYLNKTYAIFLTYPSNDMSAADINNLKKDFDQILSTFKFTN